jgi:hypothetical protein
MSLPEAFTLYLNFILNAVPKNIYIYIELAMSGPFSKEHPKIFILKIGHIGP